METLPGGSSPTTNLTLDCGPNPIATKVITDRISADSSSDSRTVVEFSGASLSEFTSGGMMASAEEAEHGNIENLEQNAIDGVNEADVSTGDGEARLGDPAAEVRVLVDRDLVSELTPGVLVGSDDTGQGALEGGERGSEVAEEAFVVSGVGEMGEGSSLNDGASNADAFLGLNSAKEIEENGNTFSGSGIPSRDEDDTAPCKVEFELAGAVPPDEQVLLTGIGHNGDRSSDISGLPLEIDQIAVAGGALVAAKKNTVLSVPEHAESSIPTNDDENSVEVKPEFPEIFDFVDEDPVVGYQGNELSMTFGQEIEKTELEEEIDAHKSRFNFGDFVWVRNKGHLWWPGQIYDPSDASDLALKNRRHRNEFLVVFFGNKTYAWSSPSHLKSFAKSFQFMSVQSISKSFLNAVEDALNELGRCVKLKMVCSCVSEEDKATLIKPVTVNPGIKEGVTGPEGCIGELLTAEFDPASFLTCLKGAAQVVGPADMIKFTVYIRCVSAFRWFNGYGRLAIPHENLRAPDPEDNSESETSNNAKFFYQNSHNHTKDTALEVAAFTAGPLVDKSGRNLCQNDFNFVEDKHQKKKRSMAELLQDNMDSEKAHSSTKRVKRVHNRSPSSVIDKEDENDTAAAEDGKSSTSFKRRRKAPNFEPLLIPEEVGSSAIKDEDSNQGSILTSPRIRKKSKYLSPPYTMIGRVADTVTPKDVKRGTSKSPRASRAADSANGLNIVTEASLIEDVSQTVIKRSSDKISKKNGSQSPPGEHETLGHLSPHSIEFREWITTAEDFDASADEILSDLLSAALSPLYLKGKQSAKVVKYFFNKYRSSTYRDGSDFGNNIKVAYFVAKDGELLNDGHEIREKDSHEVDVIEEKHVAKEVKFPKEEHDLSEKDSSTTDLVEDELAVGDGKTKSLSTLASSVGNDSYKADQSVPKSGCRGRKRKSQSDKHVLLQKDLQAHQLVPICLPADSEGSALHQENTSFGSGSAGVALSPSKSSGGRKRKTLSKSLVSVGKDSSAVEHSQEKNGEKTEKKGKGDLSIANDNLGKSMIEKMAPFHWIGGNSGVGVNQNEANEDNPVALYLTFAPGFDLPSAEALNKMFGKFGALVESETVASREASCARLIFARSFDAEALNKSDEMKAFGPSIVSSQLQYLSTAPMGFDMNKGPNLSPSMLSGTITPLPSLVANNGPSGPPLQVIQQNLQTMMSMLSDSTEKEGSTDKLPAEVQANLAGEIKGLLQKVTTLMDP